MKKSRRKFLKESAISTGIIFSGFSCKDISTSEIKSKDTTKPIVISTWNHGLDSNKVSWEILLKEGNALDAVEQGVKKVESDPSGHSVGLGGAPDRDGYVTLDACIMNHKNQCGAVACLQNIENPISVARKVMEDTPHTMLVGDGAYQFAIEKGFPHKDLLTTESKINYEKWLQKSKYEPEVNVENHDTIGALALDSFGNLAGACTTSGMAYKMHGRVGDSPIIGAGLFVDNEVGAACATGMGEAIVRVSGSAIIVEMMRNGYSPQEACEKAVQRIIDKHEDMTNLQVGFIALDKYGNVGACSAFKGFNYAVKHASADGMVDAKYLIS